MNGQAITGRKQNIEYDFYETPEWATRKAVEAMISDGIITAGAKLYEPCCGAGAIARVINEFGLDIMQSDIQTREYITGEKGIDVYGVPDGVCDVVITNPPYDRMTKDNMLQEFLRISKGKVILLLNIFYLASKDRKEMLDNSPLRHIYVHSDRVTMYPYGTEKPKNGGTKMYAWYVWDKEYAGPTTISRI